MPVPNGNEKTIKIHRDSNYNPTWPPQQQQSNQGSQQETRTWSTQTVTKRYTSNSSEQPQVSTTTNKSSDLYSNAHDRRGSSTPGFGNNETTMKSSSLVRNAMGDNQDLGRSNETRRDSRTTTYTSHQVIPSSTPELSIVPSNGGSSPGWSMGTDAGGDVPVTYEVVTKADGKKEFQLLLTARQFSPQDLQVKLTDNTLYISGKHEERSPSGAYSQKSFYRSCTIPPGVRPEDLNCSLDSSGRLKITAPLPDEQKTHKTTKTITTQQTNWHEAGVPSGFTIKPAGKEQVITVFNEGKDGGNVTRKEERSSSRTVRTFKTVA